MTKLSEYCAIWRRPCFSVSFLMLGKLELIAIFLFICEIRHFKPIAIGYSCGSSVGQKSDIKYSRTPEDDQSKGRNRWRRYKQQNKADVGTTVSIFFVS
jgi:hypothetical protein